MIAVPAGLISALRRHSAIDHTVTVVAFLGLAMPDFWVAILLIILFAAHLQWLPAIGYVPLAEGFWPWLSHLILPSIAIGTTFAAIITRMIRSSMLEVLKTDYMQVARAKGLLTPRLIFVHAFPNALIPVVTVMGIALALLMAGTVVVENVFAIKGLGPRPDPGHPEPRLSGRAGRDPGGLGDLRLRQPAGRRALHGDRPAHPLRVSGPMRAVETFEDEALAAPAAGGSIGCARWCATGRRCSG